MRRSVFALAAMVLCCVNATTHAVIAIDPFYAGTYSYTDLGSVAGVPTNYGGIDFKPGDRDNIYLGGAANGSNGAVYKIPVTRNAVTSQIETFGAPTVFSTAPTIDGGLDFGPDGVLFYAGYSGNILGQIKPGSVMPDKTTVMTSAGVASSMGALQFVPTGFAGAGRLKLLSYNASRWYDATVSPDGSGTFNISVNPAVNIALAGGLEGAVYIKNTNPLFADDSVLVAEYVTGVISSYEIDANGDPVASTKKSFMTGLSGALGASIDPYTGDFYFSTFGGGNKVVRVQGFLIPEPTTLGLLAVVPALLRRRR
jgi:hypothetical protein